MGVGGGGRGLIETVELFNLAKTMVSVLRKELECKVQKLKLSLQLQVQKLEFMLRMFKNKFELSDVE